MANEIFTKQETQEMVDACQRWFHCIDVGHGIITPGTNDSTNKLKKIQMPASLEGLSVLDVGANDGFFSFEAERRGAARVLATDYPHWTGIMDYHPPVIVRKENFDTAKKLLGSNVEEKQISIYDISPETVGMFDVVICLGVLYHLIHPTVGIENLVKVAKKLVIVESTSIRGNPNVLPLMYYTSLGPEKLKSNWWHITAQCVIQLLMTFGCSEAKRVDDLVTAKTRYAVHGIIGES